MRVTVVDYGLGNLHSVIKALVHVGAEVQLASQGRDLRDAERIVLPGVGAFADGMSGLRQRGHDTILRDCAAAGCPILGICLGAQLLLDVSLEFGRHEGLGIIPGRVEIIPPDCGKVPHVGWSRLQISDEGPSWTDSPLAQSPPGTWAYFVHSYQMLPSHPADTLAWCMMGKTRITAAIGRGRVFGMQFHPEKSGHAGLAMFRTFVDQAFVPGI